MAAGSRAPGCVIFNLMETDARSESLEYNSVIIQIDCDLNFTAGPICHVPCALAGFFRSRVVEALSGILSICQSNVYSGIIIWRTD